MSRRELRKHLDDSNRPLPKNSTDDARGVLPPSPTPLVILVNQGYPHYKGYISSFGLQGAHTGIIILEIL